MNKNILIIQSHCNTETKLKVLSDNLEKLKKFDLDILLFSHIPLPEDITKKVDYFIFDSTNPILWEERRHYYWWANDRFKMESTVPDYGWTVFNQIIGSYEFLKNKPYEHFIIFCYDVIIDENIELILKNPKSSLFIHQKPPEYNGNGIFEPVILGTALIFSVFEKLEFDLLIKTLSKEEYANRPDLIAEKYFETKLKELGLYKNPEIAVFDYLSESQNIFDLGGSKHYSLFLDNQTKLKFIFRNLSDKKIQIIVNNQIIETTNGQEVLYDESIEQIDTLGCLIENNFHDWNPLFFQLKKNTITFS